jgi:hypothetical protein
MFMEKSLSRAPRTSASWLHRRSQELHACVGTGGAGRTLLSSRAEDDGARRRIPYTNCATPPSACCSFHGERDEIGASVTLTFDLYELVRGAHLLPFSRVKICPTR